MALGVLDPAPHAIEAPLSKVRLRRVRLRKRGLAADAKHVRHNPWFILIVMPGLWHWHWLECQLECVDTR